MKDLFSKAQKYTPLCSEQERNEEAFGRGVKNPQSKRALLFCAYNLYLPFLFLVAITSGILGGILGFGLGRLYEPQSKDLSKISVDRITKSFIYNRTFSERPSEITDEAWESIFPPHGGFFHHPSIAPEGASLAVYHQLHCLDGIRHAYWAIHDAVVEGRNISLEELPDYSTPWHTRHCIDFLRQMLMCNADTTIEHNDPTLHGIVGFGINHTCKRWDQVFQWTVDRQLEEKARE